MPLVAALACAPRVEHEHPTPPAEVSEASEPACPPISLDEAAEITVAAMERRGWRYLPNKGWSQPSSMMLPFEIVPYSASVAFGISPSSEELDEALTLPTGVLVTEFKPLTDEQLAGIGERAMGFTMTQLDYVDHSRGTRRQDWKYSHINFFHCDVIVQVGSEGDADGVVSIARELDEWLAQQACC